MDDVVPVDSTSVPTQAVGTWRFFRLMLWVHWRTFLAQVRVIWVKTPLLLVVLAAFIGGYLVLGFYLFNAGFGYLRHFPLVGALLSQRIVFLVFTCFFVMLVFSNLIIGYSVLFRNRETAWLLSLPIRHRDVYRWKFVEGLVVSSWALIFLSAPMMWAYGQVNEVPSGFYGKVAVAYLPFVILPGLIGSWMVMGLAHIPLGRWLKRALVGALLLLLLFLGSGTSNGEFPITTTDEVVSFDKMLQHTRFTQHLLLPSSWLAQMVLASSDDLSREGVFYFCVLLSNALMGILIAFGVVDRFFFQSWTRAISSRAERFHLEAEEKRRKAVKVSPWEWFVDRLPLSPPIRAMVLKDSRLFWRDPAQWLQFMIFFGLLCIYVVNLRNIAFTFQNPYWETLISYLNLAASALTLSTLTTRFVFPQFSLEGRRLWIVGLAPVGLPRVLMLKFWSSFAISSLVTVALMVASSMMLNLSTQKVLFFAMAITILSGALSGLAVGLGALFPNLREDNPSRIVSGFGGTLCLAVSFIYIMAFVALVSVPAMEEATLTPMLIPGDVALAGAYGLSVTLFAVPMFLALRRVKSLEF